MKKLVCLLLALLLFVPAVAEMADSGENVTPAHAAFGFRNGVTWGASPEAVQAAALAAEGTEGDLYEETPWMQLNYASVSVSNYEAELRYLFREDQLVCIVYDFYYYPLVEADCLYLTEALSSKYGDSLSTADTQRVQDLMELIDSIGDDRISLYGNWELEDGTYIAALSLENKFFILYFDEPTLYQLCGIDNTSGL